MKKETWVVKIGSQLLIDEGPMLIRSLMKQVVQLKKTQNIQIVWVTSGAIATARQRRGHSWKTLPQKQALSSIGQPLLMEQYNTALAFEGLQGAQILLTANDLKNKTSKANFKNSLQQLLEWDILPIINENDAVSTEEIRFGDNDQLSALIACEIKAHRLILLTNVNGVYSKNPSEPDALHYPKLDLPELKKLLSKFRKSNKSDHGTGGIFSKLSAAEKAAKKGVETLIVQGQIQNLLLQIAKGESVGTRIKYKKEK